MSKCSIPNCICKKKKDNSSFILDPTLGGATLLYEGYYLSKKGDRFWCTKKPTFFMRVAKRIKDNWIWVNHCKYE